jgi:hypothetical protein
MEEMASRSKILDKYFLVIMLTAMTVTGGAVSAQPLTFLSRTYTLGSFNQKNAATWEYAPSGETVNNWTTLITLIDRPDAKTMPELDRLAQGVMETYQNHGGRVLLARTMKDASGASFNYLVAAFDEPAKQRVELNFVRIAMGPKNARMTIYGVRVTDARLFLTQHSSEIGQALEALKIPDLATLPRR